MSGDQYSADDYCIVPSEESSSLQPRSRFEEGEEARHEIVTGSYSSRRSWAPEGASVCTEYVPGNARVLLPEPHSGPAETPSLDLRRERFAQAKKDSTESESSKSSDGEAGGTATSTLQDSGTQCNAKEFYLKRAWFCKNLWKKKSPVFKACEIPVAIPTAITRTRCDYAKLLLHVIPYKEESTPWPQRYSYLACTLRVPGRYVYAITMENACKVVLDMTVTGDGAALPDDVSSLHFTMDVPEGACEHSKESTFLSQPTILDANCEYFYFLAKAKFELTPRATLVHEEVEVEGEFMDITVVNEEGTK